MQDDTEKKGAISWMVKHPVTANLFMYVLLIAGAGYLFTIKQEVFPNFDLDIVSTGVSYPGATPDEIEKSIVRPIEDAIEDIEGIKEIRSSAREGSGSVQCELTIDADDNKVYQDIKNAVDRITSFPEKAEDPTVSLAERKREVLKLIIYGSQSEKVLRNTAEKLRTVLLSEGNISQVELAGARDPEISIEVPMASLRRYEVTLSEIAARVRATALEMGGGSVKTSSGEVLLKLAERRDWGREYARMPMVSTSEGVEVTLGDVGKVIDGFVDSDSSTFYNNKPAVLLNIFRVGSETPKQVSAEVHRMLERLEHHLPDGLELAVWNDRSDILEQRIDLLGKNIAMGLILVVILLGCFLQVRLAFWVMMGIPISFLGAFIFMPGFDLSINMVSLFALIMALGMVVDDAIVVGENVFEMRQRGMNYIDAAIAGAKQVAIPVTFSIATNIVAFAPLLFVPGAMGKIFRNIPIVVIAVFIISLFESLFILPAHLAHQKKSKPGDIWSRLNRVEMWFGARLKTILHDYYRPFLVRCIRYRYLTLIVAISVAIIMAGYFFSGRMTMKFFPDTSSDVALATIELPYGSPVEQTELAHDRLVEAAYRVNEQYKKDHGKEIIRGVYSGIGYAGRIRGQGQAMAGGHTTTVEVFMIPPDERTLSSREFKNKWQEEVGDFLGAERIVFLDNPHGPGGGDPISLRVSHSDFPTLERAANDLAEILATYDGVKDIESGLSKGKPQYDFKISSKGRSAGLNSGSVAQQVRSAFYGVEALRQLRERDEIKVMVRLPESERRSVHDLYEMIIRTPQGGEMPLRDAVLVDRTRAETSITRINGRRRITVAADIVPDSRAQGVVEEIFAKHVPILKDRYPGISFELGGSRKDMEESMQSLMKGLLFALFVIYALLAIPFNSYLQPAIIMVSIPFGVIGAVLGHLVMGYDYLCLPSMMGIVALSGVVVNDSLVLVDYANNLKRKKNISSGRSVMHAGMRRFRPIMLTSLTTFGGLAPMIFETSRQAQFMIPMALSLGYGILFATLIALILVPALYVIIDDIHLFFWGKKELD